MDLSQRKLDRLNRKLTELQKELDKPLHEIDNIDELIKELNKLEQEKKIFNKKERLDTVNRQHEEKRKMLKEILAVELPTEATVNNDGSFHARKIKDFPEFLAVKEKFRLYGFVFNDEGNLIRFTFNREDFSLLKSEYGYNEPTRYLKLESFEEVCKHNRVLTKSMTLKQYLKLEEKILKESERIKAEVEKSQEKIKNLNSYFLESEKLINSQRLNYTNFYSI